MNGGKENLVRERQKQATKHIETHTHNMNMN